MKIMQRGGPVCRTPGRGEPGRGGSDCSGRSQPGRSESGSRGRGEAGRGKQRPYSAGTVAFLRPRSLALAVVALALVACGPSAPRGAAPGGQPASGAATSGAGAPASDEIAALVEPAKREGRVVLYGPGGTTDEPVYEAFMRKYPGIQVQGVALRGSDMMARVNAEVASGQRVADLFQTGQSTMYEAKKAGLFEAWTPPNARELALELRDPDGYHFVVRGAAYGIMYNTNLVPRDQAPTAWRDLADPKWRRKILLYDPRSAGSSLTLMMEATKVPELGWGWVESLGQQEITFTRDRVQGTQQVAQGVYPLFAPGMLTDYFELRRHNAPVELVLNLREGMHFDVSSIGLLRGAPHPNAAKLYMDFVASEEGQRVIADLGQYPVRAGVPGPEGYPPMNEIKALGLPTDEDQAKHNDYVRRIEAIFR